MPWFNNLPKTPVTVIHVNDWTAIYVGDELKHWHDSLSEDDLLDSLGFNVEYLDAEDEAGLDLITDERKGPDIDRSLKQLKKNIAEAQERKLQAEIDAKQNELDSLKSRKRALREEK